MRVTILIWAKEWREGAGGIKRRHSGLWMGMECDNANYCVQSYTNHNSTW